MIAVAVAGVEWVSEPTPSGVRWVADMPRHQLVVYGDETILRGAWNIDTRRTGARERRVAYGDGEKNAEAAKLRAVAVYAALVHDLTPST